MLEIVRFGGALALVGSELQEHIKRLAPRSEVQDPHITILAKHELRQVSQKVSAKLEISQESLQVLSLGEVMNVRFLIVSWPHAQYFRKGLGFSPKDFHITLSSNDRHEIRKDITTTEGGLLKFLEIFGSLSEVRMDFVLADISISSWQSELCEEFLRKFPQSYRALIRLADNGRTQPHIATNAYARALSINPGLHDYVTKKLRRLSAHAPCGPFQIEGMEQLPSSVTYPWPTEARLAVRDVLSECTTETRIHVNYLDERHSLPRFFSMVLPYRLAVMSTPRNEHDIDILAQIGVTTVLSLTKEEPLNPAWFRFKGISNVFIPIENYEPPTLAEMDHIFNRYSEDNDGFWLIHCGGGKGRAGTVTACLLAMHGSENGTPSMEKSSTISLLRQMRPGSLETSQQEQFVGTWLSHRWKEAHTTETIEEPEGSLIVETKENFRPDAKNVRFLMLIGLPGSGKSYLAESIALRRSHQTIIISQDESRSRASCETQIQGKYKEDTLIILDRCNPEAVDRKYWLSLLSASSNSICVFFKYSPELCMQRINNRMNHPTIQAGRGRNPMNQMLRTLQKPSLQEGFGAVLTVTSHNAAREAILILGGTVNITKFPRTAHLLNLGAGTPDDLVNENWAEDLKGRFVIEEKVDGANMGFSLDFNKNLQVQNRSHYVNYATHAQFKPLRIWLEKNDQVVIKMLDLDDQFPERYVLYGEWLAAKHSIAYASLPDFFLAFDFYDRKTRTFVSRELLTRVLEGSGIHQVPLVKSTTSINRKELLSYMSRQSDFYDGPVEGVYVRFENRDRTETVDRGKVVRADFITGNEHWTRAQLQMNQLRIE